VKHGNADALSRRPCRQCGKEVENPTRADVRVREFEEIVKGARWTRKELTEATGNDA